MKIPRNNTSCAPVCFSIGRKIPQDYSNNMHTFDMNWLISMGVEWEGESGIRSNKSNIVYNKFFSNNSHLGCF